MTDREGSGAAGEPTGPANHPDIFGSQIVDRVRSMGNVWELPNGRLVLPRVFGFCRGVRRALSMLQQALSDDGSRQGRLFLLGEIIHNPWVNRYFAERGVRVLSRSELGRLGEILRPEDCAVIPAFGVSPELEAQLERIGCRVVDTSCGDVRRLWQWGRRAVERGFGVLIFGRADHDETLVTKARLAAAGGKYVVAGSVPEAQDLCDLVTGRRPPEQFPRVFAQQATNAESVGAFERLAQVSQTTMLYEETMRIRDLIRSAFERHFGAGEAAGRVLFEPTVCRATQDRQSAAVELCRSGPDLAVVVGGFGSSNTRHVYELARDAVPAWFIEDAEAIRSQRELATIDLSTGRAVVARDWLPPRRPLTIGVLAGASSPEVVLGQVLERLAAFLA